MNCLISVLTKTCAELNAASADSEIPKLFSKYCEYINIAELFGSNGMISDANPSTGIVSLGILNFDLILKLTTTLSGGSTHSSGDGEYVGASEEDNPTSMLGTKGGGKHP